MFLWAENFTEDCKEIFFILKHLSIYLAHFMQVVEVPLDFSLKRAMEY